MDCNIPIGNSWWIKERSGNSSTVSNGSGPDASIHRLLQSTRGAWTDAPGRRARIGNWMDGLPYSFLSIKPRNSVIWGGNG
jgi:hypothetical protein